MAYDLCIIGGGIVGLSTAYQLLQSKPGLKILVLEKEVRAGMHQTGHNSGVIHSGIYYKPGSYKAINCLEGYRMLLEFCRSKGVEYKLTGKLIIATKDEEIPSLEKIYRNGLANGLSDLAWLNEPASVRELEPNVHARGGILVPQTGIIDYGAVIQALLLNLSNYSCEVHYSKEVTGLFIKRDQTTVICSDGATYSVSFLINSGGLQSDRIARMESKDDRYRIIPFKGVYYRLCDAKKSMVERLIYPVPDPRFPFLGIHFTRTMDGNQILGPNAILALYREGYHRSSFSIPDARDIFSFPGFWKLIARHWRTGLGEYRRNYSRRYFAEKASEMAPGIHPGDLEYAGSGIRAQLVDRSGMLVEDFVHFRTARSIHICNAPSPAATAGLAIGKQIANMYFETHS
ncbi:MAG: L-2-hydroxyglutarate oxidase LhgO [Saprospiraceae bacterium]|nr:L-2-hydroxyglutarate oxidase LhgO [Saprospiraceae bacterium]